MQYLLSVVLLSLFTCLGCSPAGDYHAVKGRVIFRDRQPVKGAMIEFVATDGTTARAKTDQHGKFELATGNIKGVRAGYYRVAIIHMIVIDGAAKHSQAHHARLVVHPKYAKCETSGLTRDVQPGTNDFTIEVETAAQR
ncbi:MAG TPA: carboxypeptidase-like regulatory domain-containing protein [Gemmatales bacterium]|nr:carboxypeptidase-like regulatory domain-containing protein [Gemmatales bacterium]HMP15940.1 carboxypeptidase-like regulatory domain-containing protein [Gemmatales bacterium]